MIYILPFIIALIFTPLVRQLAVLGGIVDKASGDPLKIHREPVALLGGAAVLLAMTVGVVVANSKGLIISESMKIPGLIVSGMLVFGVGFWDDMRGVSPKTRLKMQVLAGMAVFILGLQINFIPLWWVSMLLTLFYIMGAINAFNVTDGMDGLCAGISLISCIGFFLLGLKSVNMLLAGLAAVLFMSLLGFLPYNFHPAKIFLGDAGSGFLGFMLGVMAVMATSKPFDFLDFITPILVLGIPVLDMMFAIVRRFLRKKPLFAGDRDHLYDLLLKKGWSQPKVWCVMCGAQAGLVGIAVLLYRG